MREASSRTTTRECPCVNACVKEVRVKEVRVVCMQLSATPHSRCTPPSPMATPYGDLMEITMAASRVADAAGPSGSPHLVLPGIGACDACRVAVLLWHVEAKHELHVSLR